MTISERKTFREGTIALVTGASRGIGRGIALQLADAGAKVYITGRQPSESAANREEFKSFPSLEKTKKDIEDRNGTAVLVYCDHSNADDVQKLFEKIEADEGRLDILVNNAFSAVGDINFSGGKPFYELDPLMWDSVNNVGLRNHYICAVYAAKMMVGRGTGLIVNISSIGGLSYAFNVAYGCGKAALDRMAADMAEELKDTGVTIISLWPGAVKTEAAQILIGSGKVQEVIKGPKELIEESLNTGETPEFAGRAIVHFYCDRKHNNSTGKILFTTDLARKYGFKDIDGRMPMDMRSLSLGLRFLGWNRLASFIPLCIRIPHFAMHFVSYKF